MMNPTNNSVRRRLAANLTVLAASAILAARLPAQTVFHSGHDASVTLGTLTRAAGDHPDNGPVTITTHSSQQVQSLGDPRVVSAWMARSEASAYQNTNPTRAQGLAQLVDSGNGGSRLTLRWYSSAHVMHSGVLTWTATAGISTQLDVPVTVSAPRNDTVTVHYSWFRFIRGFFSSGVRGGGAINPLRIDHQILPWAFDTAAGVQYGSGSFRIPMNRAFHLTDSVDMTTAGAGGPLFEDVVGQVVDYGVMVMTFDTVAVLHHDTTGMPIDTTGVPYDTANGNGAAGVEGAGADRLTRQDADRAVPNPFRESVVIDYSASAGRPVTIDLMDARGSFVRRIDGDPSEDGPAAAVWDGRDQTGATLPPGAYFYRVCSGSSLQRTGRILFLGR
ncbi:MAG TPA: FlgD immunoglobulin-like domain containing protein [Candidatus Kapabacteria bacterium]|nr:FlgD immunoglobulin-like domain containing protein [Candidatus Kapabacteria bacterium]